MGWGEAEWVGVKEPELEIKSVELANEFGKFANRRRLAYDVLISRLQFSISSIHVYMSLTLVVSCLFLYLFVFSVLASMCVYFVSVNC